MHDDDPYDTGDNHYIQDYCDDIQSSTNLVPFQRTNCVTPLKRSMSFLSLRELFSYKAIPAIGVIAYLGTAVGTSAHKETYQVWFGSEYTAINMINGMTLTSILGTACYMYGRRHVRHAGAFERVIYPLCGSMLFNCASHFCWAFIKEMLREQQVFDYHWKVLAAVLSGLVFLYTGRSYLNFVDHW